MKVMFILKRISLLILFVFFSCGSRKVEILKTETEKKEVLNETIKTIDTSNVKIQFDYKLETFTIEAKDNLRPFYWNKQTYNNVVIKHEKIKDSSLYLKDNKVSEIKEKQVKTETKQIIKDKKVDKKEINFKYIIYFLVFLCIYILWKNRRFII